MDEATLERYVQLITDRVYEALAEKEDKKTPACASSSPQKVKKYLITENDVLEMAARQEKQLVCDGNTILTPLAKEMLEKKGIAVVSR